MNKNYKKYIKYIILTLCLVIFSIFTYKVVKDKPLYIDDTVYNYISNNIINENRTKVVKYNIPSWSNFISSNPNNNYKE